MIGCCSFIFCCVISYIVIVEFDSSSSISHYAFQKFRCSVKSMKWSCRLMKREYVFGYNCSVFSKNLLTPTRSNLSLVITSCWLLFLYNYNFSVIDQYFGLWFVTFLLIPLSYQLYFSILFLVLLHLLIFTYSFFTSLLSLSTGLCSLILGARFC